MLEIFIHRSSNVVKDEHQQKKYANVMKFFLAFGKLGSYSEI